MSNIKQRPHIAFIRELCKHLPEERIQEAEANVWMYVETAYRIAEHMERDIHTPDSTERDSESTIQSPEATEGLHA